MENLKYKPEFFELINQLTSIDDKIIIESKDGVTQIRRQNSEKTAAYILKVPNEYFGIDTDIGFYKFSEFYRFFRTFNEPDVKINTNKIILSKDRTRVSYLLNDTARMKTGPNGINFENPDYSFELPSDALLELVKMHVLIKNSKHSEITCLGDNVNIKIVMSNADNTFDKTFDATPFTEQFMETPLQIKIFSKCFMMLPPRKDYIVSIKQPGFVEFKLKDDNIDLGIYTSMIKKRAGR